MPLATMLLIGLTVLLAAGLVLFVWGLIGKRIGTDPHCRKCRYNLTGLEADKCPECGQPATGKNVRIGLRQRRRPALYIGALLSLTTFCAIGAVLYSRAENVNWYTHLPLFVLMQLTESDDPSALKEILARTKTGRLDGESLKKLIPLALQQPNPGPRLPPTIPWLDFLRDMELRGYLTSDQQAQFRDQMLLCRIKFRPKARRGEKIKLYLEHWYWGPKNVSGSYSVEAEIRITGRNQSWTKSGLTLLGRPFAHGKCRKWQQHFVSTDEFSPGVYRVEFHITKRFTDPALERKTTQIGELEILPSDGPTSVRLVRDLAIGEQLRRAISITSSYRSLLATPHRNATHVEVKAKGTIPIDGAFEFVARIGDHEITIGELHFWKGTEGFQAFYPAAQLAQFESFVPILRSSVVIAEEVQLCVSKVPPIDEIWYGELIFDPVQIAQPPATAPAQFDEIWESAFRSPKR